MSDLSHREVLPDQWQPLAVHPVDLSLDTLQGAIGYAVGQRVELGLNVGEPFFEKNITGAVNGSTRILAYGAENPDVWELSLWSKKLETPYHTIAEKLLDARETNAGVDRRKISQALLADAEVKSLGQFTRDTIRSIINIQAGTEGASGIDLANVSRSQASRIIDVMRNHYADANWRQTLQLAMATSHITTFIDMARQASFKDSTNRTVTVADDHIKDEVRAEYRTDVDLLIARALKRGVIELRADGRPHAASHAEAWLSLHEEGLTLDSFPPEVTTKDILTRPSYLNPRPDKGIPRISSQHHSVAGTGSRNYAISYPDGSVYAVDFPLHSEGGARPIDGNQEQGHRGNLRDNADFGTWLDFRDTVEGIVAGSLVKELLQKQSSFKNDTAQYAEILRTASGMIDQRYPDLSDDERTAVKTRLAAVLAAIKCVEQTGSSVGVASGFFNFSLSGWGIKRDAERETGIGLTFGDGLDADAKQAYQDFGQALAGYELARLSQVYAAHPELARHIARVQGDRKLTGSADEYFKRMMEAGQRLVGKGPAALMAKAAFEIASQQRVAPGVTQPTQALDIAMATEPGHCDLAREGQDWQEQALHAMPTAAPEYRSELLAQSVRMQQILQRCGACTLGQLRQDARDHCPSANDIIAIVDGTA